MIPFVKPSVTGIELTDLRQVLEAGRLAGDGPFTQACSKLLEQRTGAHRALLTHSCTAALEMAAMLIELEAGDEIIMPSFTFVSTANAFVLRGAVPVFVDIRPDTLNLDERLIEQAITARTRAIVTVHYAGVACNMEVIQSIAARHGLVVIEDAAQAVRASYRGRPLGTIGQLGALSFHETKNITCGEGGALLLRDGTWSERAEIIREKGTNRSRFFRGQVDKYTWVDVGSSLLPSELNAAFLKSQLVMMDDITDRRLRAWHRYHCSFEAAESRGLLRRPVVPADCEHNAHMYYLLTRSLEERTALLRHLRDHGIHATFHYVPLHSSPAGQRFGRVASDCRLTNDLSDRLIRLPLFDSIAPHEQDEVVGRVLAFLGMA